MSHLLTSTVTTTLLGSVDSMDIARYRTSGQPSPHAAPRPSEPQPKPERGEGQRKPGVTRIGTPGDRRPAPVSDREGSPSGRGRQSEEGLDSGHGQATTSSRQAKLQTRRGAPMNGLQSGSPSKAARTGGAPEGGSRPQAGGRRGKART
jgi:hypothetical protein